MCILDHWEMCTVRNIQGLVSSQAKILDHWEMCTVRNETKRFTKFGFILDHWEMCTVRNPPRHAPARSQILDHWEMCTVRPELRQQKQSAIADSWPLRCSQPKSMRILKDHRPLGIPGRSYMPIFLHDGLAYTGHLPYGSMAPTYVE